MGGSSPSLHHRIPRSFGALRTPSGSPSGSRTVPGRGNGDSRYSGTHQSVMEATESNLRLAKRVVSVTKE